MQYTSLNCKYFTRCDPVILFESNVLTSLLFFFLKARGTYCLCLHHQRNWEDKSNINRKKNQSVKQFETVAVFSDVM